MSRRISRRVFNYARIISNVSMFPATIAESVAVTTGRVYLIPLEIVYAVTIDRIGVTWASAAAGNARVGIYRDNGDTPVGGAVVVQSASIAKSGTNRTQEFTVATTSLQPGLYWIALVSDENTTKFDRYGVSEFFTGGTFFAAYYDRGGGYGALTDPCPAITALTSMALHAFVRVASVP